MALSNAERMRAYRARKRAAAKTARRPTPARARTRLVALRQPFTVVHFRQWARQLELDNGDQWDTEDFQEAFVEDLFAGVPECWLIIPEGNAKTTLFAGLGLYHIEHRQSATVPIAASSRDQAEILFRQAEGLVERNDRLRASFTTLPGYRRIRCDRTLSRIQIFAADERTGDGAIYTLALVDELHRHRDLRLYRTWRGKLEKRGGQIGAISTRGEPGGEFELTLERIRHEASDLRMEGTFTRAASPQLVLHQWAVPDDGDVEDIDLVKRANPLKAITAPMLAAKRASPTMTLSHWKRFVCNLPTRSDSAAIAEAEWFGATTTELIPEGEPIWLGLDVAWKHDTTAAVPLWWKSPKFRLLGPAAVFVPPRDGTSLDPALIEKGLLEIHERNPVHTVVMDMTRAEQLGRWIGEKLGATVIDRAQTIPLAIEDYERFMEALREGWLKHQGDPALTTHVLNAVARMLPSGGAMFERTSSSRSASGQDRRVIDGLVAAAMVHSAASAPVEEIAKPWVVIR
jgi:phage terminase large subunit-like protein